jgi:dihydrofolate reductase
MRKIIATIHLSLDGVVQAPGRPGEDDRGGFDRGGWASSRSDEVMGRVMGEGMAKTGALLLGRRTYEDFASFWPSQEGNPFTEVLGNIEKYVASTTLAEPLVWKNSRLLKGDAASTVAELKEQPGPDLAMLGSGNLIQTLRLHNLIEEYVLLIHPVVLGSGFRLFPGATQPADFQLVDSVVTTTGVIIGTYRPA